MERSNPELDERVLTLLHDEITTLQAAQHPNIVNLIAMNPDAQLKKRGGQVVKVIMIVLELAQGGELFDIIAGTGNFADNLARYYFS